LQLLVQEIHGVRLLSRCHNLEEAGFRYCNIA
jgi:hypothetical protein